MDSIYGQVNTEAILHFIRSYRRLEQLPLEDGFAEIRCIVKDEDKALRQHFRNHWFSKERAFGRFYLNLPHYRQIYLLHYWDIRHYEDDNYLWECERNSFFSMMEKPPETAYQLHQMVKFFENHGINKHLVSGIELDVLPEDFVKRYGNSTNWGDYILSLSQPVDVLYQIINYEDRPRG